MDWRNTALIAAGLIGSGVALVHGRLMQRLMVRPISGLIAADATMIAPVGRLVPPLFHFTTFNWFFGGLALIAAAFWLSGEARLVAGLLIGSSYLYGALLNGWATRGRHPGWILYAIASGLILFGVAGTGS